MEANHACRDRIMPSLPASIKPKPHSSAVDDFRIFPFDEEMINHQYNDSRAEIAPLYRIRSPNYSPRVASDDHRNPPK
jgi:hypothetical protein